MKKKFISILILVSLFEISFAEAKNYRLSESEGKAVVFMGIGGAVLGSLAGTIVCKNGGDTGAMLLPLGIFGGAIVGVSITVPIGVLYFKRKSSSMDIFNSRLATYEKGTAELRFAPFSPGKSQR